MLQLSFLAAIPQKYLANGWHALSFPGDSGPLVGLTLLLGLGVVAVLLLCDAAFSPFGTTLVYTAATSRILYGMAENKHLPAFFLKLNRHKVPYVTLYINFLVGSLSFLPFPGWQKMVAFLSSASILSYGAGPICLLAMRKLQPTLHRPFKLSWALICSHIAFFVCNMMLYWCGFSTIWKLCLALGIALIISLAYQRKNIFECSRSLYWFLSYMGILLGLSYLGSFGGLGLLKFPEDILVILPFSIITLYCSQFCLGEQDYDYSEVKVSL
jgi:amino acid transporter